MFHDDDYVQKGYLNKITKAINCYPESVAIGFNATLVYNSISSEYKEKLIVKKANHNLFVDSSDQDYIFQKINSFFNQFHV